MEPGVLLQNWAAIQERSHLVDDYTKTALTLPATTERSLHASIVKDFQHNYRAFDTKSRLIRYVSARTLSLEYRKQKEAGVISNIQAFMLSTDVGDAPAMRRCLTLGNAYLDCETATTSAAVSAFVSVGFINISKLSVDHLIKLAKLVQSHYASKLGQVSEWLDSITARYLGLRTPRCAPPLLQLIRQFDLEAGLSVELLRRGFCPQPRWSSAGQITMVEPWLIEPLVGYTGQERFYEDMNFLSSMNMITVKDGEIVDWVTTVEEDMDASAEPFGLQALSMFCHAMPRSEEIDTEYVELLVVCSN